MRTTLERVLGFPSDHPAVKIIERAGLLDLPSLLSFPLDNFDSLKDSSRAKIIDGYANALKLFICLCGTIYDRDKAIDFDAITKVQFDNF